MDTICISRNLEKAHCLGDVFQNNKNIICFGNISFMKSIIC